MRELNSRLDDINQRMRSVQKKFTMLMKLIGEDLDAVDEAERCLNVVSIVTGIPVKKFTANSRKRELVEARFLASYLIRQRTDFSLETIGELVRSPRIHHADVIYGIKQVENDLDMWERKKMDSPRLKLLRSCNEMFNAIPKTKGS